MAGRTTQRGLGYQHQKQRAALIPAALNTPCPGPYEGPRSPRCTGIMRTPALMDLDHYPARAYGPHPDRQTRLCCSYCNRHHGARLGRARQARQPSRPW